MAQQAANQTLEDKHSRGGSPLGPILCWAVVFADIGTTVYYVPGILYNTNHVRDLAGFFVFLTMSVFVLLTLKYAEVTHRFPLGVDIVRFRELRLARSTIGHIPSGKESKHLWHGINFWLGILTTVLVITAWSTNLITKPQATAFGGSVAIVGMIIAYFNHRRHKQRGYVPVVHTHAAERMPDSILAVLTAHNGHNIAVMRSAIDEANGKPIVFLYVGAPPEPRRAPRLFELVDPYWTIRKPGRSLGRLKPWHKRPRLFAGSSISNKCQVVFRVYGK